MSDKKLTELPDIWESVSWDEVESELAEVSETIRVQRGGDVERIKIPLLHELVTGAVGQGPQGQEILVNTELPEPRQDQMILGGLYPNPSPYQQYEGIMNYDSTHEWNKTYNSQYSLPQQHPQQIVHTGVPYQGYAVWEQQNQILPGNSQNYFQQENTPPPLPVMYPICSGGSAGIPCSNLVTTFEFWLGDPFDPCDISGQWERISITAPREMKISSVFEDYFLKSGLYSLDRSLEELGSENFTQIIILLNGQIQYGVTRNYEIMKRTRVAVQDTEWYTEQRIILRTKMSRRKNKIIASSDGWSNVIGKGRSPLRKPSELNKLANCSSHDSSRPIIDYDEWFPGATGNLAEKVAELGASKLWEEIKVEVKKFGHEARRIKNVVVLGLGSLQGNTKESSFWQLALALEMSRLLHGKDGYSLYIQDPAFTETDIKFFSKVQKATVLQHPEAEAHITEETFLFAPHLEYEILQESLKYHPVVVFCNDLQNFMDTKFMGLKDYPEFVYYLENFNSFVLGGVDSHDDIGGGRAFNHSALYWRSTSFLSIGASIEVLEQVSGDNNEKMKRKEKKEKKDIDYIIENIKDVLI